MAHASKRSIPFVAMIGDEERARGEVAIKDMRSGEQKALPRRQAIEEIRARSRSCDANDANG